VVRRLHGRVHARRPALLLPADDHRLRKPLSLRLRGALHHQGSLCFPVFKEFGTPKAIRTDNGVPLASPKFPLQPLQALSPVAQARYRDRAHQTRPPAAELNTLEQHIQRRIVAKVQFYVSQPDPLEFAQPLTGHDTYRFRVGDYRLVFEVRQNILYIVSIRRRDEAYR
jgi:mRNA-degrading endonuclease RelE of RelBE toxin-antitoxin system